MNITDRRQALQTIAGSVSLSLVTQLKTSRAAARGKQPIKVGQIGVGHAHATKLSVFKESPDYEVVGIAEPNEKLRKEAESRSVYQDVPWMTVEQLLNIADLELVLVETRVRNLLDTAELCIAAGKHIHLDKPAGASLSQFGRLLESAEKQQLLVQMGYMYRYNPGIVLLREVLKKGWLGEPFEIHAVMSKVVRPESRLRLGDFSGGTMFELGCHLIDLVFGVMGTPDKVTPFPRQVVTTDKLVDNMLAVFEYPSATATVKSSGLEVEGFKRRHFVVCGTEGTFHIQPLDDPAVRVAFADDHGKYQSGYQDIKFPEYIRYVDDAVDIAQIIRGEKASDFSYAHDLAVQKAVLEASNMPRT